MARVCIVGTGYVGLCTGVALARHGHDVTAVDAVRDKVDAVQAGRAPFFEPGLEEGLREALRQGRLRATTDLAAAVQATDFTFLCVGTPQGADGAVDLGQVRAAAREIGAALRDKRGYHVVIVKSTVVPGTAETVVTPEIEAAVGKKVGGDFAVASNPEFLKEGSAMADALGPDRILVGATDSRAAQAVWGLYAAFKCPKVTTTPAGAETIKYVSNAFLAAKVAFSNEMANLCERLGVDWYDVAQGVGLDARIGSQFLRAGVGFGGSCFPKDLAALAYVARQAGAPSKILQAVLANNETQPLEATRLLRDEIGELRGARVALLGLAFKPDTDDVRESRALPIYRALRAAGARIVAYDPKAGENFRRAAPDIDLAPTLEAALRGADAAIVQTEWQEFRDLAPSRMREWMRQPVVVDGRRTFDPAKMQAAGIRYRAIGLGAAASKRVRQNAIET